ncbi:MAG: hypothetical protein ACE5MH_05380 [Terriglobia bacterium]
MIRKTLVILLVAVLVPGVAAAAYTVILKDGRRIEAREKYVLEGGVMRFVGTDGHIYHFAFREVDLEATRRANTPKFVWTNDELERLRPSGRVNIVGTRRAEATAEETPEAEEGELVEEEVGAEEEAGEGEEPKPLPPREKDPAYYRERLQPLRRELAQVERRITDLQRNIRTGAGGAATGGVGLLQPSTGVDPRDTLQQLQRRRDDLQRRIAAIEDEARRNGISPGQLR